MIVSFEIAKKIKLIGYSEPVIRFYFNDGMLSNTWN